MMTTLKQLEKQLKEVRQRNRKVEVDKAWELSWTRKIIIAILTYVLIAYFFYLTGFPDPFVSAFVPMIAFVLSTLTLSFVKGIWVNNFYRK